ncbi:MAG: hypothetical protein JSV42_03035, partial [Chloroflexota bacterium]
MDISERNNSSSPQPGANVSRWTITFLVLATLIAINSKTLADADLWGHLRFGLDFLESGVLTQVDPYSYLSAGQRWINHEWLAEVVFALAWSGLNVTGLVLLKTVVGVTVLGLIYFYLIRSGIPYIRAAILVILSWAAVFPTIATVRPHMFTLLFSGLLFLVIAKAESGRYRWLWTAPPIFILWVNFHGGFLAGLGFLAIWAIFHTISHHKDWIRFLPQVILSFLAVLINPYGIGLITFLLRTATVSRPEIQEWQPVQILSFFGGIYLLLVTMTIIGLVFSQKKKSLATIAVLVVSMLLPLVAVRHLPLFALAVLVFGGEFIADAWSRLPKTNPKPLHPSKIIPIISVIGSLTLLIWGISNFFQILIPNQPKPFFPDRAVVLLEESQVRGNLAVEFNWGEYVIWHLSPNVLVSVDGRRETVYPDDIYRDNMAFLHGQGHWDALLDNYDTNFVLVGYDYPAYNLMK